MNNMADTAMMSLQKGSDTITDFWCSPCQEDFVSTEADFYCEMCRNFYCFTCINLHSHLFKRHGIYGRKEMANWPAANGTVDLIAKCEEHPDKTLKVFCEDHLQLCCNTCVVMTHRQCTKLTLISEYSKTQTSLDFRQLSAKIQKIQTDFRELQQRHIYNLQSVKDSYTDQLQELRNMRKKINAQLDELEKATVKGLDELKTKLNTSLNAAVQTCSLGNILHINRIITVGTNKVLLYPKRQHNIQDIFEFPNGHTIIAETRDKQLKLLDQTYQELSQCNLSAFPMQMCQVSENEVAAAVDERYGYKVQFISESKGKLVKGRTIELSHGCIGLSYLNNNLYVTSQTALFHYTAAGRIVKKIYEEDTTGDSTKSSMGRCAVHPSGDYIYVISQHKLLTLTKDGQILSTFSDPKLEEPCGICVTPAGQVLVCYYGSNTIIQLDCVGRSKIAALATEKDGVLRPLAICYSKNTNTVIVGQLDCFYILHIKVK
ncbi:uncharacterized protein LOC127861527 isoform X5 [Dreissena polymorpha]|uniref:uncharacterized protein LOC127861527 isoform X5 n=1 Tax=Dreissena polymorpha TaxID=45954 RepID=UPI0022655C1E|nr:uncharacterized protein LOC127861527 isoform X5 [Dreissena polymorpha]